MIPGVKYDALISPCGLYRYWLSRTWDESKDALGWVMLNPSKADASIDDPTIIRCVGFAQAWGYGAIVVFNLFALRATDPRELYKADDPVGPENDAVLKNAWALCGAIVAAWGAHGKHMGRGNKVNSFLHAGPADVFCLGRTKDGSPKHPLYLASETKLQIFSI